MSIKRTFQMTPKNDKRTGAYRACCSGLDSEAGNVPARRRMKKMMILLSTARDPEGSRRTKKNSHIAKQNKQPKMGPSPLPTSLNTSAE